MPASSVSTALIKRPGPEWALAQPVSKSTIQPSGQGRSTPTSFPLLIHLPLHTLNKSPESDRWKSVISSGEQLHLHGNIQTGTEFFREGIGFRRQLWMESCCWRGGGGEGRNDPLFIYFSLGGLHLSLKQPPDVGAIKHSLDKQGTFKKKLTTHAQAYTHTHTQSNNQSVK